MNEQVTNRVFTIPNFLTVLRLLLLPVFWVLLVVYKDNILSFLVLLVAALTDLIDGFIARSTHTVSRLGQQLDPAVDRIFIVVCVIAIFVVGRVPLWILLILLTRDASMLVLTIYQKRRFGRDFEVIFLGKLTTALLMAGFCSLVLWWPVLPGATVEESGLLPGWGAESTPLGSWLLYAGVLCSIGAALIYLYKGTRPSKGERASQPLSRSATALPLARSTTASSLVSTAPSAAPSAATASPLVAPAPASPASSASSSATVDAETVRSSASHPGEGDRL
jgi:cardiolipin synthase